MQQLVLKDEAGMNGGGGGSGREVERQTEADRIGDTMLWHAVCV